MLQYGCILYHMQPYTSICQHTLAYAAIAHASIYASTCCVTMFEHFWTHPTKLDLVFKICAAAPTRSHTFHKTVFSLGVSGFRRVPYCITRCVQNIVKHKENALAPFSARKHCRRGVSKIIGSKIDAPLIGTHDNRIMERHATKNKPKQHQITILQNHLKSRIICVTQSFHDCVSKMEP